MHQFWDDSVVDLELYGLARSPRGQKFQVQMKTWENSLSYCSIGFAQLPPFTPPAYPRPQGTTTASVNSSP